MRDARFNCLSNVNHRVWFTVYNFNRIIVHNYGSHDSEDSEHHAFGCQIHSVDSTHHRQLIVGKTNTISLIGTGYHW